VIKSCPSRRTFVACPKVLLVLVCVLAFGLSVSGSPLPQGASQGPHIYIDDGRSLLSNYVGPKDMVQALTSAGRPLSLASADFNEDSVTDLAVGYADLPHPARQRICPRSGGWGPTESECSRS
jgi:hypothetical protein